MGNPVSNPVAAGEDIVIDQYNDLRIDALNPGAMGEPTNLADFSKSGNPDDLLESIGFFEEWPGGTGQPPKGWKRSVAGVISGRLGAPAIGGHVVRVQGGSGGYLYHRIYKNVGKLRGKYVTAVAHTNSSGSVSIADDSGVVTSTQVSGSTYGITAVEKLIDANATFIEIRINRGTISTTFASVAAFAGRFHYRPKHTESLSKMIPVTTGNDPLVYVPSIDDSQESNWVDGAGSSWADIGPFPTPALIFSADGLVRIYDDQGDLWMEFTAGTGNALEGTANTAKQISMADGRLFICWDKDTPDTASGLVIVDFANDVITRVNGSGISNYKGTISQRNSASGWTSVTSPALKLAGPRAISVHAKSVFGNLYAAVGSASGGLSLMSMDGISTKPHSIIGFSGSSVVPQVALSREGTLAYVDKDKGLAVLDNATGSAFALKDTAASDRSGTSAYSRLYAVGYQNALAEQPVIVASSVAGTVFDGNHRLAIEPNYDDSGVTKNNIYIAGDLGVNMLVDDPRSPRLSWLSLIDADHFTPLIGAAGFAYPLDDTALEDTSAYKVGLRASPTALGADTTYQIWHKNAGKLFNGTDNYAYEKPEAENIIDASADLAMGDVTANTRRAQGFQLTRESWVGGVYLNVKKVGSPSDNIQVQIQTDSSGVPSGTVIGTSVNVAGSALTTSFQRVRFSFTTSTGVLSPSTQYHIVIQRTGALSGSNYYVVESDPSGDYAGGTVSTHNGSSWTSNSPSGQDIAFEYYTSHQRGSFGDLFVSAWVTPTSVTGTRTIAGKWSTAGSNVGKGWRLYLNAGVPVLEISVNGSTSVTATSSITLEENITYHIAAQYVSTGNTMAIYINGQRDQGVSLSGAVPANIYASAARLAIGCDWSDIGDGTGTNFFNGVISHVSAQHRSWASNVITGVSHFIGHNSVVRGIWEMGRKAIAARRLGAGTGLGAFPASFVLPEDTASSLSRSGRFLLTGTATGGVSMYDLGSASVKLLAIGNDHLGSAYASAGSANISGVHLRGGFALITSDAHMWIEEVHVSDGNAPDQQAGGIAVFAEPIVSDSSVGASFEDAGGASVTLPRSGRWLIIGNWGVTLASNADAEVCFNVGGVDQPFVYKVENITSSGTASIPVTKTIIIDANSNTIVKLRIRSVSGTVGYDFPSIYAVWVG